MKKMFLVLAVVALAVFIVSCGGSSDDEKTNSDTAQDAENSQDAEASDSTVEDETADETNEEVDAETSATSKEESDEENQTANGPLSCSNDLCTDPSTKLMWSPKSTNYLSWQEAKDYCENLEEGGYSDWHLPTISELRTMIQDCEATMTDGTCQATDSCLSFECKDETCGGCEKSATSQYSKAGDTGDFWSSSELSDEDGAWYVCFCHGEVNADSKETKNRFRCVRAEN